MPNDIETQSRANRDAIMARQRAERHATNLVMLNRRKASAGSVEIPEGVGDDYVAKMEAQGFTFSDNRRTISWPSLNE